MWQINIHHTFVWKKKKEEDLIQITLSILLLNEKKAARTPAAAVAFEYISARGPEKSMYLCNGVWITK